MRPTCPDVSRLPRTQAALLGAVVLLASCATTAEPPPTPATVRVLGSWTGSELEAFREVVKPFAERTGIEVDYTSTRDLERTLRNQIDLGDPPDVVGLLGPAHMTALARDGRLRDLGEVLDLGAYKADVAPAFVELGTVGGRLVGVFLRSTLKGLIWFRPTTHSHPPPGTWAELELMIAQMPGTPPWCVGLASRESSGWPGTDWIESFLLHDSGTEVYDEWVAGELAWTSPDVRAAFLAYGRVVAKDRVAGGSQGALRTDFADAGDPMFEDPPGCLFLHQGSFMPAFFAEDGLVGGVDYDFFPFPPMQDSGRGAVLGGGDLFGLMTDDPAAEELIRYLVSAEAQAIWVSFGGTLSVNSRAAEYPDDTSRRMADVLQSATSFRFDASDLMPAQLNAAFWQAVLDYTESPDRLDPILRQLEAVRTRGHGD
jgi:alpha-glucoside transport system substrate-binding protein